MGFNRDSIIYSSIRALFNGFFLIVGIFVAFIPVILIIGALSSSSNTTSVEQTMSVQILPDSSGVRTSSSTLPVLLYVKIDGIIGADDLTMEKIRTQLTESQEGDLKDNRVKGILLHINSPGGTVIDADGIYHALRDYKARYNVPIVAYTEGLCASGGMYVACAADKIYASNATLVGSVGVLVPSFVNVSQLLDKIGVQSITVSAGKGKDEMNPMRPWKPNEDASFQAICDYYYLSFVSIVTSNRPEMNKEKLISVYGAHVFPAAEAKEYGFIDGSGYSQSDVLKILEAKAGLEGQKYQVVELESKSFLSQLLKAESPLFTGKIKHEILLTPDLNASLNGKFLYLHTPG